jgi:hypothetical protein
MFENERTVRFNYISGNKKLVKEIVSGTSFVKKMFLVL